MRNLRYSVGTKREFVRTVRALRRAARVSCDPADVVDAVIRMSDRDVVGRPIQIRREIIDFLALLRAEQPAAVLEVGTGSGGTLYLLCWAAAENARVLSLDIRQRPFIERLLHRSFGGRRKRVAAWTADSHATETRAAVERYFRGLPLDVLFIDGDHSFEGVRRDYELYAPLVRPGGLIAFHDIVDGPDEAVGEVPRFWREVRSSLDDTIELVDSWSQGGYGIGVGRAALPKPRGPG